MAETVEANLDAIIKNAVEAKIEAAVLASLAGDEVIGRLVSAALQQQIEVGDSYRKTKTTYLLHTINECLKAAVKAAVQRYLAEQVEILEAVVAKELRRQSASVAEQLVGSLAKRGTTAYGLSIEVKFPNE